jgi:ABC-type sugar transport system permease subunit
MVLNQRIRGRTLFRTVFFLPSITAGIAIYILWSRLFNKDFGLVGKALPSPSLWLVCAVEMLGAYLAVGFIGFLLCKLAFEMVRSRREIPLRWFLLPAVAVWIATLLDVALIHATGCRGHLPLANWIAGAYGRAGATGWLTDPWLAKPALIIMRLWTSMGGYNMILYLAALQNIDPQLYEAADIDGASRWQKFARITWPLLTPTTFFIFVTNCISGFQGGFDAAYIMTNGGPASTGPAWAPWAGQAVGETTTLSYYIFNNAYVYLKMGYAAALAWFLFALIFTVTMINWKYGGRKVEY